MGILAWEGEIVYGLQFTVYGLQITDYNLEFIV
jgi:hypothetical protein